MNKDLTAFFQKEYPDFRKPTSVSDALELVLLDAEARRIAKAIIA